MSELLRVDPARSRLPLWGTTALSVAAGFVAAYFGWPILHEWWPPIFHTLFWAFIGTLTTLGLGSFLWRSLPERLLRRIPRLSRHRVHFPREGVGYLLIMSVLFVGASLTHSNTLLLVFAAMAGPFVVNGSVAFTMLKSIRVARTAPRRVMAGELFNIELLLENTGYLISAWMMAARDEIDHPGERLQGTVLFTRVPPRKSQAGHYQVRLVHRGRHRFGPVWVESRFPLGLIERGCLFHVPGEILVYPRIGRLTPTWKRQLVGATELVETPQPRQGVFEDEFHHLREYRPGDNPRAIHWRSSARRSELIVREFQQNREHNLTVLVELYASLAATPRELRAVEQALSLAATLCVEHRRACRGARLTVVLAGRPHWRWDGTATAAGFDALLDRLAGAEAVGETGFAALLAETLSHATRQTRVVVVSTRSEASLEVSGRAGTSPPATWVRVDDESFAQMLRFDAPQDGQPADELARAAAGGG